MDWAINSAGDHVRAGTRGANAHYLRCPVCNAEVYHKHGRIRRPHFAHYSSGNSRQACELYHFSADNLSSSTGALRQPIAPPFRLGTPALVWKSDEPFPISLRLRLPRFPIGYASALTVVSGLGRRRFSGESLARPAFAEVQLQEPPARLETTPRDVATEFQVSETLRHFKLSGNFFRATADGGVLENQDTPLELGEEYFLVTQRRLQQPPPDSLEILQERNDRSWTAYRIRLREDPRTLNEDIAELKSHLRRDVVPSRPKVSVVWPPPHRFDPDGVPVFDTDVCQVLVRSTTTFPGCTMDGENVGHISNLGEGLYLVQLTHREREAAVWVPSGSMQQIRFETFELTEPDGILLKFGDAIVDVFAPQSPDLKKGVDQLEIVVPTARLWRNILVNGRAVRPLPNGDFLSVEEPLSSLEAGAFGKIFPAPAAIQNENSEFPFYRFGRLVTNLVGHTAFKRLSRVRTKFQLIQWAIEHKAQSLLPLMLVAISAEVERDIP